MKNLPRAIPRVAVATALVGGLFAAIVPASTAADVPSGPNVTVAGTADMWQVSSNARYEPRETDAGTIGTVRRKSSKGRAAIWMRTPASDPVPEGTKIQVSGRVSTREVGRKVRFELREFSPSGERIQRFAGVTRSDATTWRWTGAHLTTEGDNSTVRLFVKQPRTSGTKALRLGDIHEVITLPDPDVIPDPDPDPDPEGGGGGDGGGEPVDPEVVTCEDIDYSDPTQGIQTFGDEFDGDAVDTNRWRVRDKTYLSFDDAWISKDNVSVHNGVLDIMGMRQDEPHPVFNPPGDRYYSTGYLDTMDSAEWGNPAVDRFSQKYGHFEMRAKVPTEATMSRGIWPAFWLRGDSSSGEIDIMEAYGAPNIRNFNYDYSATYQWSLWANTNKRSDGGFGPGTPKVGNPRISDDFHVYGFNWSPTCMRFLFDGQTVGIVTADDADFIAGPRFDSNFNIRLNMQIGSDYWGRPSPAFTRPEFHYLVDYVRAYQALPAN